MFPLSAAPTAGKVCDDDDDDDDATLEEGRGRGDEAREGRAIKTVSLGSAN